MERISIWYFCCCLLATVACAQPKTDPGKARLIGTCEGCEAIFEYGNRTLSPIDTLPDFSEEGRKIRITGTVYQIDGQTPAPGVILYVYHTNQKGIYENKNKNGNWERRHGYIRGWIKTDQTGAYTFYTLKPAPYPNRTDPAHIHLTALEPDGKYYWLESYYLAGDPLLTPNEMTPKKPRGMSSGVLTLKPDGPVWEGKMDIVLGKNVPGYE